MTSDWSHDRPDDRSDAPLEGAGEEPTDLDPASEEELWVARTLAEQPDPPLPPTLERRLDARLAALVAERRTADGRGGAGLASGVATGVPARTRRRRWPQVLLAAAAVMVGGYAVGTGVVGSADMGSAESSAAGDSAEGAQGGSTDAEPEGTRLGASTVPLRSEHLRADVRRLLATGDPEMAGDDQESADASACAPPPVTAAATVWLVEFDGAPAVLVATPRDGRVRATVYSCATAPLASTTVRAP